MPKLSALTAGNLVKIPLFGRNRDFYFLQYNHYARAEAVLYMAESWEIPLNLTSETIPGAGSTQNYFVDSYWPDSMEMYWCYYLKMGMPDSIRASLVDATITGGGYDSFTMPIFQPSSTEIGLTKIELRQDYQGDTVHQLIGTGTPQASGSAFSWFSSANGKMKRPKWVRNYIDYKSVTYPSDFNFGTLSAANAAVPSQELNGVPVFYCTTGYGLTTLINTISGKIGFRNNHPGSVQPILLLNANAEVTGTSTNYTISKTAAIETYRKIDGVWYRTI